MANIVFNVAKGKGNAYVERVVNNDPANSGLVVVLLKTAEADATLQDYDTLSALFVGGNVEADFGNYARKVLTDADLSAPTVDDSGNLQSSAIPQIVWTAAGTSPDNTLVKAIICYDPDTTSGTDANLIPLTANDVSATTNGNNLTINAGTFYTAS